MSVLKKLLLAALNYGDEYDPGATGVDNPDSSQYSAWNPPPGMMWDPASQTFIPNGNGNTAINPLTGQPYTSVAPAPGAGGPTIPAVLPPAGGDNNTTPVVPPGGGSTTTAPGPITAPSGPLTQPFTDPAPGAASTTLPTLGGSTTTIPGAPPVPTLPKFMAPTLDQAMNEPGYKFGYDTGERELKNWLAAHGTFNDSSAVEALTDYGRNAAQTQYSNVWNRAYQTYQSDLDSQYLTPWQMGFQNWAAGTVNPTTTNFQTMAPLVSHQNDQTWQNSFNTWLQKWNVFKDQRDSTFDKTFQVATA